MSNNNHNARGRKNLSRAATIRSQDVALQLLRLAHELQQLGHPTASMRVGSVARDLAHEVGAHDPHMARSF